MVSLKIVYVEKILLHYITEIPNSTGLYFLPFPNAINRLSKRKMNKKDKTNQISILLTLSINIISLKLNELCSNNEHFKVNVRAMET